MEIIGNGPLKGKIRISGAKNSALKLIAATILTDATVNIENIPFLADISSMNKLLTDLGTEISLNGEIDEDLVTSSKMSFNSSNITKKIASYDIVKTMRGSAIILGPLLAKYGEAEVSLPGGCAIGSRPLDVHINQLKKLGADIKIENGYIKARAPEGRLVGSDKIDLTVPSLGIPSVGATETLLMASVLAKGTSILNNAAREPEIVDLANMLNKMGAKISGIGTTTLTVEGVDKLHGCDHRVMPDRIEAGTYAVAALMTNGELELVNGEKKDLGAFVDVVEKAGGEIIETKLGFLVRRKEGQSLKAVNFETAVFPGVSTDLQAQLMTLMTVCEGSSEISEKIFENRFMHVPELNRLGADINEAHSTAVVNGPSKLTGCSVMATDLRASASLVLAGLVAEGNTTVNRIYHLDRGYEFLEQKLASVGAKIRRVRNS